MKPMSNADYNYIEDQLEKYEEELREKFEDPEIIKNKLAKYRKDLEEEVDFDDDEEEVSDLLRPKNCELIKSIVYDGTGSRYIRYAINDGSGYLVGYSGGQADFTLDDVREWL